MGNAQEIDAGHPGNGVVAVRGDDGGNARAVGVAGGAVSETAAILSMIERAARDPQVDVDKLERLFSIQQAAEARRARASYDAAFSVMQPHLPEIDKRGKIIIKAKDNTEKLLQSTPYALWEDTSKLIRPVLAEHGFGLSFRVAQTDARLTVTAVLSHVGGHREETSFSAPIDNTGSKNNVQGWGSSMSYCKRYAATALLNITTRGEDDDGKAAGHVSAPENTLADLRKLIADTGSSVGKICEHFSVGELEDLSSKQVAEVVAGLKARQRGAKK